MPNYNWSRRLYCVLMENQHDLAGQAACYACYPTRAWAERGMAEAERIWPDRAKYVQEPPDGPLPAERMARHITEQASLGL